MQKASLVTSQGASTTILRDLFWNLRNIFMLELEAMQLNIVGPDRFESCLRTFNQSFNSGRHATDVEIAMNSGESARDSSASNI